MSFRTTPASFGLEDGDQHDKLNVPEVFGSSSLENDVGGVPKTAAQGQVCLVLLSASCTDWMLP